MSDEVRATLRGVSKDFTTRSGTTHALSGVDLVVEAGASVAIVGPNGAGKSTLLRLIAGILVPTSGTIHRHRRCASLIELGAGYHDELTGRENLDLGLSLAGFPRRRLRSQRDLAIDFSGLGSAIDLPIKQLSSGMLARLACAAALHSEPELLLIDEVLAVGDSAFQRATLERVGQLRDAGAALLLVTHSLELAAVATSRSVWIDRGAVVDDGPTNEVLARYDARTRGWGRSFEAMEVEIASVSLDPSHIEPGEAVRVTAEVVCHADVGPLEVRLEARPIIGDDDLWMRSAEDSTEEQRVNVVAATAPTVITHLAQGSHRIDIWIEAVPITSTALDLAVIVADGRHLVIDEVACGLTIGATPMRPAYDLQVSLTPAGAATQESSSSPPLPR